MTDSEIEAMSAAIRYMNKATLRSRQRFIFHLVHRYFPKGQFSPEKLRFVDKNWLKDHNEALRS